VQELERNVTALKANLASKGATLREAQDSLSETDGKLHEEYDKNNELSRENTELALLVERLQDELRQSEEVRCMACLVCGCGLVVNGLLQGAGVGVGCGCSSSLRLCFLRLVRCAVHG
jgi:hypothetical protein